jgi:hypothetical protein
MRALEPVCTAGSVRSYSSLRRMRIHACQALLHDAVRGTGHGKDRRAAFSPPNA